MSSPRDTDSQDEDNDVIFVGAFPSSSSTSIADVPSHHGGPSKASKRQQKRTSDHRVR